MENASRSRTGFVIAGSALVAHGFLRKDIAGWLTALAGGAIALFALSPERTRSSGDAKPTVIQRTVTVAKQPAEAYAQWRRLENFPQFVSRLSAVRDLGGNRHSWSVRGKLGVPVRWETEIVNDQPGRVLEWRSVEGSPIQCRGSVRFKKKKGDRGTKIHLQMTYIPARGFSAKAFNDAIAGEELAPETGEDLRQRA
jgi:uncharacterized membrane protein